MLVVSGSGSKYTTTQPALAKAIFRVNYSVLAMANDCQQQIRLLELYRTGEMDHKCLTRDEFLSLLSESALPFRLVLMLISGWGIELNQSRAEQTFFYFLHSFLNFVCSVVYLSPTTNMRPACQGQD